MLQETAEALGGDSNGVHLPKKDQLLRALENLNQGRSQVSTETEGSVGTMRGSSSTFYCSVRTERFGSLTVLAERELLY